MSARVVTVYTKPGCKPCEATKRDLAKLAVSFTEVPIDSDPGIAAAAAELGLSSAPIVCADTEWTGPLMWAGYRPDHIAKLVHPCE